MLRVVATITRRCWLCCIRTRAGAIPSSLFLSFSLLYWNSWTHFLHTLPRLVLRSTSCSRARGCIVICAGTPARHGRLPAPTDSSHGVNGPIDGIGGHLEVGEEWPKCAEREVLEETGLEVSCADNRVLARRRFFSGGLNEGL